MNSLEPSFRDILDSALRYWEWGRIPYNVILAVIVLCWFAFSWPHFRALVSFAGLQLFFVLAVLANVCYSAAYLVDIPLQYSSFRPLWVRRRWLLWGLGMLLASVLANYWLADEVYPFVV